MKKSEFVALVAEASGLSKKDAERTIDAVFQTIGDAIAKGDKLQVGGFGTFEAADRAKRMGYNPRTGERTVIPAAKAPVFRAASALKAKVNGK